MIYSLDTNVLVRLLTQDDPTQTTKAKTRIKMEVNRGNSIYISNLVLLETIWVLESCYDANRVNIIQAIRKLLGVKQFIFDGIDTLHRFIKLANQTNCELSDILISVEAEHFGVDAVLTFDKKAGRLPMFQSP